jgi:hypothetical protein
MKHKALLIISFILTPVLFLTGGIFYGYNSGNNTGYVTGYDKGSFVAYEKGYTSGYDNGKEFVLTHLEQYVTTPKAVKYDEVVAFLKADKTSDVKYTDDFDCVSFANMVRENALNQNIKCGEVSFNLKSGNTLIGHCINIFETTDRGIVYFDPQTDGQRYDVRVGGTYILQGVTYKITKVDVIW